MQRRRPDPLGSPSYDAARNPASRTTAAPSDGAERETVEVSIVMPCLNEASTIGLCIDKARQAIERLGISAEIIVADNGSSDGSPAIADTRGARVVHQPIRGYGSAYLAGFEAARGRFIVMADSDNTYDFSEIGHFLEPLRQGFDLVMGSRFRGRIQPGAMPWSHQFIGNPVLTGILNLFFRAGVSDAHCGMRAFTREACARMRLQTTGMEFASEMVINACKAGLRITEVPITYYPRDGASKLRSIPDGWRHLRFMLLYSPNHLFLLPGLALLMVGLLMVFALVRGPLFFGLMMVDFHYMIVGAFLAILGSQILTMGICAKVYSAREGFATSESVKGFLAHFTLERGLLVGSSFLLLGAALGAWIFVVWMQNDFRNIFELRTGLLALTLSVIGLQTIFTSFFVSILVIPTRPDR